MQHVGCIARPTGVHHVECVFTNAARHNRANRNTGLDDGVQAILPVADAAFMVKFDSFAGELPLATLDGRGHRLDAPSGSLAVGSATVKPFLGEFRSDGHDLEVQARLGRWWRLLAVGLDPRTRARGSRGGGSARH